MSDEEVVVEEGIPSSQNPLVSVTFQRDSRRKEKYLEAEPKALGITQIGLGLYKIIGVGVLLAKGQGEPSLDITLIVLSLLVVIAGYVAVSAQNLHLPKKMHAHFFAGGVLIQAALLAISVTLAAYCCKVVNCCGPAPKMPMITVQTPQRAETNQLNVQD
ncbi:uncharacterized protein LOC108242261 isoform X2 [Kryptolebias marmoratus]|uniref:uncharacterized protein LOC108242261 isoform X2 n=1 Tax=Kryptolebias marmoratus TaxID=37003 RepID=UPI0018AC9883|nr:uncharacterized protein LOC108242261 isoform X2 [Kryptolebias marmoratus]